MANKLDDDDNNDDDDDDDDDDDSRSTLSFNERPLTTKKQAHFKRMTDDWDDFQTFGCHRRRVKKIRFETEHNIMHDS